MSDIHRLLEIMATLRDPERGCPWDLQQTFATVAPYTIEEAYEVADAIDRDDYAHLKDELGDLLLQVVFHARMAEERQLFAFGDVVDAICDKMTRRHPHVFPDATGALAASTAHADAWEAMKRKERGDGADASVLDGVATGMPEWQRALKLQKRAATVGFDWPSIDPVLDKLHEEIDEVRVELEAEPRDAGRLEDEIGDVLFVCANLARHAGVDVSRAVRRANAKFERRFRKMEAWSRADGMPLASLDLEAQDAYWNRAKAEDKAQGL